MRLQQLRDLLAVVSHGGYRAAARALDVSQAGLTKSLAKLEEEHDIVLIERTSQGIALSAAGGSSCPTPVRCCMRWTGPRRG